MKKFSLPIVVVFLGLLTTAFLLPQEIRAQKTDCHGAFNKESNSCLKGSTECINSCVEKGYAAMSLAVDGAKVSIECQRNVCDPAAGACNNKAKANFRACGKSGKQPGTAKTSKQGSNWLEFLGINPYQTWLRVQELVEVAEFYASGDLDESLEGGFLNLFGRKGIRQKDEEAVKAKERPFEVAFGKDWREQLNQPKLDVKTEEEAWESPVSKEEPVIDVSGTSDTKRYSWDENSGAVVKSNDWERIKFREPVEVGGLTTHTLELGEGAIEVKVRNNNPAENQFGVDAGWLGVTVSRTHFYVSKDPNGKFAIVSVYEGEVEVKTRDGKIVKVKPDGNKPGVVVVSRKISLVKLAVVGLILVVTTGGIVFLLIRRKFTPKGFSKKRK